MANMTFKANLLPNSDLGYSLGSSEQRWNVYGDLIGNATTATKLSTASSLKTKLDSTTAVTFDGSAAQDAIPVTGTLGIANGGTGATTAVNARANLAVPYMVIENYPALLPTNASNNWIKIGTANTSYGLLPSQAGNAGSGHNYLGTSSWYWKYAYIDQIYGYLNGNISGNAATATKISSTPNNTTTFLRGDNTWSSTLTGNLTIANNLTLNGSSGEHRIDYKIGDTWIGQIGCNSSGTNFYWWVHDGSNWKTPLSIARSNSNITLTGKLITSSLRMSTDKRFIDNIANVVWQGNTTGMIVIKLPYTVSQYDMPVFKIYVYEYSGQGASEILIGGHNWPSGSTYTWYNASYAIEGNYNKGVRLGHNGSNYCIFLGNASSSWSYVGIYIEHCFTQYTQYVSQWESTDVTITKVTSESGYSFMNPTQSNKTANKVYGAVWNDYAEYRETKDVIEPGYCIVETGKGDLILSTKRLQEGCEIVSDTYGFAIGQNEKNNTPTAASGRVLAYLYEDKEQARPGQPVCSGPNGTISLMTNEEAKEYPWCIIGTISELPNYDIWYAGSNNNSPIKVNGRVWIRIR